MRVIFAGCTVYIILMVFVGVFSANLEKGNPAIWGTCIGVGIIVTAILASWVFNKRGMRPTFKSMVQIRDELDKAGVLRRTEFEATCYFEMNEFDDEGMHIFVGLKNGKTLYLTGQYLYDYGDLDENDDNWVSRFPTDKFTVVENTDGKFVFEIIPVGEIVKKYADNIDIPNQFFVNDEPIYEDMQLIDSEIGDVYRKLLSNG
jgi:hypothetical protein